MTNVSDNDNPSSNHDKSVVCPEFVLIDDRGEQSQMTYFGSDHSKRAYEESSHTEESQGDTNSLSLRFVCFLGFIFCAILGIGLLLWSIVLSVAAACAFFRNSQLNHKVANFWKIALPILLAGVGFAIGIISPPIGLGLIAVYFSFAGDQISNPLSSILKQSFTHF